MESLRCQIGKWVFRSCKLSNDRQHNGQKETGKINLKNEQHEPQ